MATSNKKDLDLAISQIERQFGAGTLVKLGDSNLLEGVESISTGSLSLDIALGIGGIPRGRVTEIFGAESSGKTTLTLQVIAECQKAGKQNPHQLTRQYQGRIPMLAEPRYI